MEKRFVLFLLLSVLVMSAFVAARSILVPPRPVAVEPEEKKQADAKPAAPDGKEAKQLEKRDVDGAVERKETSEGPTAIPAATPDVVQAAPRPSAAKVPQKRLSLGTFSPGSPFPYLATFNNRSACIEQLELVARTAAGRLQYRNLEFNRDLGGYLGYLALESATRDGCQVNVVGQGTPAELAGLKVGDVVVAIDGKEVLDVAEFRQAMRATRSGDTIRLSVRRGDDNSLSELTATLAERPLEIMRPEPLDDPLAEPERLSFVFSLDRVNDIDSSDDEAGAAIQAIQYALENDTWRMEKIEGERPGVEFRYLLDERLLAPAGVNGSLEIVKRFWFGQPPTDSPDDGIPYTYDLDVEIEIINLGSEEVSLAYHFDGPTGLPPEGWWYSRKISPTWAGAGARDVIWRSDGLGHQLFGCPAVFSNTLDGKLRENILFNREFDKEDRTLSYIGVDTQYFAVVLLPADYRDLGRMLYERADAVALSEVTREDKPYRTRLNVSYDLVSPSHSIPAGQSLEQKFVVFAGPKRVDLLARYGLGESIEFGWSIFAVFAQVLSRLLHFFYLITRNYGLAIIMLTVLVRGCMFPISRKAAKNAQMMQELAPEMKRIAEKYKNDLQKRGEAQKELFAKHNYNPFSGCLLMFFQLPVFIGLYKCLSVDIELRQAPLIPGLHWCSNLAGPDMLFRWDSFMPGIIAGDGIGWLGPYFNILPVITVALFLVQQKLFTPPATDEQTRATQTMMKYMMVFMGVLFFKVASGLCLYFISSSIWGILERKMLPKPKLAASEKGAVSAPSKTTRPGPNGSPKPSRSKKKQKRR